MAIYENINQLRLLTGITSAGVGHLRPFMPQKARVGNDRSQSTTDVPRRRNRNEKLHKAGARSSVTLAAQNADRRAAVSEIELALSTLLGHTRDEPDGPLRRETGHSILAHQWARSGHRTKPLAR